MNEFIFGKNKIILRKGAKASGDYLIFHNKIQINDESLFNNILSNTIKEKEAKEFIYFFVNSPFLECNKNRIETKKFEIEKIYKYCINCKLKSELQEFLFITILRCDIDNICYLPPLNGCIRIFVQVLLLFSYKFKWDIYINNDTAITDIAKYIYSMGFKKNILIEFKRIYEKYLKNGV